MDQSQIPRLHKVARQVVRRANRPGGPLEEGKFTLGIARAEVCADMGFPAGELDTKEWKGVVKKAINEALETVGEEQSQATPVKSREKPQAAKASKQRSPSVVSVAEESGPDSPGTSPSEGKKTERKEEYGKRKTASVGRKEKGSKRKSSPVEADTEEEEAEEGAEDGPEDNNGDDQAEKSESEMSSLYDADPVPKKRKGKTKDSEDASSTRTKKEKRQKRDSTEELSPEEAKVVELKKIVVACGVRKQWSKEFADVDSPRDQRRRLESILASLGMKGTPTMGKARALKEKRELAAELDDVREFEAARGASSGRASRSKKSKTRETSDESADDAPRPKSALAAVMDFLGDDGDSD